MKAIALLSAKGGVGKSTLAVNLAHAAATSGGRRTLLWDLDPQGAASFLLGARPAAAKARSAIAGDGELDALVQPTDYPGLELLAADRSLRRLEGDLAASDRMKLLRRHLRQFADRHDRILIDCPPGLSELSERIFRAVDLIVVPIIPSPLSDRAARQLTDELQRRERAGPAVLPVWNMVDRRRALHRQTVATDPARPVIPYAAAVEQMAVERRPLAAFQPGRPPARAFASLWSAVEAALLA